MKNKQFWIQKLTSRKFWAAVIGFVTVLLIALNVDEITVQQVVAVLGSLSTLVAYIIGEGLVDAQRIKSNTTIELIKSMEIDPIEGVDEE